jgi:hypothetical protein
MLSTTCLLPPATTRAAAVIFDTYLQRSKGYGFVTFARAEAAEVALQSPFKEIDGRVTEVRTLSFYIFISRSLAMHLLALWLFV